MPRNYPPTSTPYPCLWPSGKALKGQDLENKEYIKRTPSLKVDPKAKGYLLKAQGARMLVFEADKVKNAAPKYNYRAVDEHKMDLGLKLIDYMADYAQRNDISFTTDASQKEQAFVSIPDGNRFDSLHQALQSLCYQKLGETLQYADRLDASQLAAEKICDRFGGFYCDKDPSLQLSDKAQGQVDQLVHNFCRNFNLYKEVKKEPMKFSEQELHGERLDQRNQTLTAKTLSPLDFKQAFRAGFLESCRDWQIRTSSPEKFHYMPPGYVNVKGHIERIETAKTAVQSEMEYHLKDWKVTEHANGSYTFQKGSIRVECEKFDPKSLMQAKVSCDVKSLAQLENIHENLRTLVDGSFAFRQLPHNIDLNELDSLIAQSENQREDYLANQMMDLTQKDKVYAAALEQFGWKQSPELNLSFSKQLSNIHMEVQPASFSKEDIRSAIEADRKFTALSLESGNYSSEEIFTARKELNQEYEALASKFDEVSQTMDLAQSVGFKASYEEAIEAIKLQNDYLDLYFFNDFSPQEVQARCMEELNMIEDLGYSDPYDAGGKLIDLYEAVEPMINNDLSKSRAVPSNREVSSAPFKQDFEMEAAF